MNPETPPSPREEQESRLTALLLGELSPADSLELLQAMEKDRELAALYERLKKTIALVRQTAAQPEIAASAQPAPLRLSEQRREKLLAHFKTIAPKEFTRPKETKVSLFVQLAAAIMVLGLLAAIAIPNFIHARYTSPANAKLNLERQREGEAEAAALQLAARGESGPAASFKAFASADSNSGEWSLKQWNASLPPGKPVPADAAAGIEVANRLSAASSATPSVKTEIVLPKTELNAAYNLEGANNLADNNGSQLNGNLRGYYNDNYAANNNSFQFNTPPVAPGPNGTSSSPANTALTDAKAKSEAEANATANLAMVTRAWEVKQDTWGFANGGALNNGNLAVTPPPTTLNFATQNGVATPAAPAVAANSIAGEPELFKLSKDAGQVPARGGVHDPNQRNQTFVANGVATASVDEVLGTQPADGRKSAATTAGRSFGGMSGIGMNFVPPAPGQAEPPATPAPLQSDVILAPQTAAAGLAEVPAKAPPAGQPVFQSKFDDSTPASGLSGGRGAGGGAGGGGRFGGVTPAKDSEILRRTPRLEPPGIVTSLPPAPAPVAMPPPPAAQSPAPQSAAEPGQSAQGAVNRTFNYDVTTGLPVGGTTPLVTSESLVAEQNKPATAPAVRPSSSATRAPAAADATIDRQRAITTETGLNSYSRSARLGPTALGLDQNRRSLAANRAPDLALLDGSVAAVEKSKPSEEEKLRSKSANPPENLDALKGLSTVRETSSAGKVPILGDLHTTGALLPSANTPGNASAATSAAGNDRFFTQGGINYKATNGVLAADGRLDKAFGDNLTSHGITNSFEGRNSYLSDQVGENIPVPTVNIKAKVVLRANDDLTNDPNWIGILDQPKQQPRTTNVFLPGSASASGYLQKSLLENLTVPGPKAHSPVSTDKSVAEFKAGKPDTGSADEKSVEQRLALRKKMELQESEKPAQVPPLGNDLPVLRPVKPAAPPQPEILARDNPFSTFSLNVSDVSFKLAAASLENGVMPDAAAIRSEEFINAFDYRDAEPPAGSPVAFTAERARDPFLHNRDLVRFSIKTAAAGREASRPLNIVLLLDNSGSMERADRVNIIREAVRVLAAQLQPQDKFSVVTFSRTARLWVDGVSGAQAGEVAKQIGTLAPEGGTNLEEAFRQAYLTALRHYLPGGINRVVLMTDGAANLGNVDAADLKQKVETYRQQGIALDCFGIGWDGYNDDLLEILARNGDGRYGFINTPEEAAGGFAAQIAGALKPAAENVKVQVEFNPKRVISWRQIGYVNHQLTKEQFRDNSVVAAVIAAAESGNALYTVELNPAGEGPIATVRERHQIPGTTDNREHEWVLPYTGPALSLEQTPPALRLAAVAGAFSEWLTGSPNAAEVTTDQLLHYLNGVPEVYGADGRPKKLEWMIRQAKSISGR